MKIQDMITPQQLVSELSDQMTAVAVSILSQAPLVVLQGLRKGIDTDGQDEVLNSIIEIVPGHLELAIERATIRKVIDESDHVIGNVVGLSYLSQIVYSCDTKHRFFGILFVMQTDMGRYLVATNGLLLLAAQTTLPEGMYRTDGERVVYHGPIPDDLQSLAKTIVEPTDDFEKPYVWTDENTRSSLVTWRSVVFDQSRKMPTSFSIPESQYDIADLGRMKRMGYVCKGDIGRAPRAATFATADLFYLKWGEFERGKESPWF